MLFLASRAKDSTKDFRISIAIGNVVSRVRNSANGNLHNVRTTCKLDTTNNMQSEDEFLRNSSALYEHWAMSPINTGMFATDGYTVCVRCGRSMIMQKSTQQCIAIIAK